MVCKNQFREDRKEYTTHLLNSHGVDIEKIQYYTAEPLEQLQAITIPISKQKIEENKEKITKQLWNQGMVRNKEGTLMVQSGNHKITLSYALSMVFNKKQRNDIRNRFEELGVDTEEDYAIDILWDQ